MALPELRNGQQAQVPNIISDDDDDGFQYGVVLYAPVSDGLGYNAHVFKRSVDTDTIVSTFDLSTIAGNPLNLPVNPVDAHWGLAIGIHRESGGDRLWVAGNSHADGGTYQGQPDGSLRLVKSAVGSISSWTSETAFTTGTGANAHTYHIFNTLPNGTLMYFLDQAESTTNSRGRDWLAWCRLPGATAWTPLLGSGNGEFAVTTADTPQGLTADRVYITYVYVDPDTGTIWVMGIWRTFDEDGDSQQRPFIIKSNDLINWTNVNGDTQVMPISWSNFTGYGIGGWGSEVMSAPAFSRTLGIGIAIDSNNFPHVILREGSGLTSLECYWDGNSWESQAVESVGATTAPNPVSITRRGNREMYHITQGTGRVRVRNLVADNSFNMGDEVPSGYIPNFDPVALQRNRLDVLIPIGNTPKVWTFGNGAIMNT